MKSSVLNLQQRLNATIEEVDPRNRQGPVKTLLRLLTDEKWQRDAEVLAANPTSKQLAPYHYVSSLEEMFWYIQDRMEVTLQTDVTDDMVKAKLRGLLRDTIETAFKKHQSHMTAQLGEEGCLGVKLTTHCESIRQCIFLLQKF